MLAYSQPMLQRKMTWDVEDMEDEDSAEQLEMSS
jgi:hypothetical protein